MSKISLGIVGGGQLGSLIATAAKKLQIKTVILCDDKNAPGKIFCDEFIYGGYEDKAILNLFLEKVDVITYEFENIPFETLNYLNNNKEVKPSPKINRIVQNRMYEKDFINKCNIRTTIYDQIKDKEQLKYSSNLIPGILKTCTMGYDGRGQHKINSAEDVDRLNIDFKIDYILEKMVNLKKEVSVIITRYGHQQYEIYEPIENLHEDQILKNSKIPADISEDLSQKAIDWAGTIAEELGYIGTMCVEYFIDQNDNLYVNEIAPRVHNSGHLTINAYNVSQFENHVRSICNLERIKLKKLSNAKMINLIGNDIKIYRNKKLNDGEFFYDYMKQEIKEKRKMGHLTILVN